MSKVVSPIEFVVHVSPDYAGTTRVELIGEDGTELYRKIFKTFSNVGYYTRVDEKIDFEILFQTHRAATAKAIHKAIHHEPGIDWLLKNQDKITHCFHQMALDASV
jgi:hypothetical protein